MNEWTVNEEKETFKRMIELKVAVNNVDSYIFFTIFLSFLFLVNWLNKRERETEKGHENEKVYFISMMAFMRIDGALNVRCVPKIIENMLNFFFFFFNSLDHYVTPTNSNEDDCACRPFLLSIDMYLSTDHNLFCIYNFICSFYRRCAKHFLFRSNPLKKEQWKKE